MISDHPCANTKVQEESVWDSFGLGYYIQNYEQVYLDGITEIQLICW